MTENQKTFRRVHGKIRAAMKEEINSGGVVIFSNWRQWFIDAARRQGLSETMTAAACDCAIDRQKARGARRKRLGEALTIAEYEIVFDKLKAKAQRRSAAKTE